jgi:predicted dehydrogenase
MVSFLFGAVPHQIDGWRSHINSETVHRDSHIQLGLDFPNGQRAFGSISKTFHGATNHFEVNLIGSKKSATWQFLNPDELFIGEGRDRRVTTKKTSTLGSKQPPHHGMGWLEGYIETIDQLLNEVCFKQAANYPRLADNVNLMEAVLQVKWKK